MYFFVTLISNLYFDIEIRELDTPSRFIAVIPIFLYFRTVDFDIKAITNGLILVSLLVGINSILIYLEYYDINVDHKHFGAYSLYSGIFGITLLFIINNKCSISRKILLLIASFFAIYTALIYGGRGAWVGSIITFLTLFLINPSKYTKAKKLFALISVFSVVFLSFISNDSYLESKIRSTLSEISLYQDGKVSGSVGSRLELWRSSLKISKENIISGIGKNNFHDENIKRINNGDIDNSIKEFSHPHNEFLARLVEFGLFGLIATILLLLFPLIFSFFSLIRDSKNSEIVIFLFVLSGHYFFYAFSNATFAHQSMAIFYAFYIALALGIYSKQQNNDTN